ncbi:MAG: 3'-5' exonuclease [Rikenellaceae bacterium]
MSKILEGLNPAQYAAVVSYEDPSLIIAGAGSGKTRVLTSRIAYMLEKGVPSHQILALTFTNKAAAQMKERLQQMVDPSLLRYISMGTFHSIFSRIIRENAELLGYPTTFTIFQPSDAKSLIKSILKELNLAEEQYKPAAILSRISYAKNSLVTPSAYRANVNFAAEDREQRIPHFADVYASYCSRCKASGALDFDDLLLQTNILLRDFPEVLARYQQRYQYILVDEYQDTNYAQYIIIRRLAQHHGRVCVVGDDAQSIYSFRGAKIENILNFRQHFPDAKTFKLEQNYRSTRNIVDAANSLISHNKTKLDKRCFSASEEGEKVRIMRAFSDRDEASIVVDEIERRMEEDNSSIADMAILYRTNSQSQAIEQALRYKAIPYKIHKGNSFYEHKEIKDMLAYIRLVINPLDDEAFRRIINYPARGIGNTTQDRIEQIAKGRNLSMWESVDLLVDEEVSDSTQRTIVRKVRQFVEMIREIGEQRTKISLYDFGLLVANRSGILPALRLAPASETQSAIDNIEELLNTLRQFTELFESEIISGERSEDEVPTIEEWLQSVALLTDQDGEKDGEKDERITLMTVHSSKGLEYDYVFIVGVEHNLFPSQRAVEMGETEEERRLFYVALTRAKRAAMISYCDIRYKWGTSQLTHPSTFLSEIDTKYLDIDSNVDINSHKRSVQEISKISDIVESSHKKVYSQKYDHQQIRDRLKPTPQRSVSGMRSIGRREESYDQKDESTTMRTTEPTTRHTEPTTINRTESTTNSSTKGSYSVNDIIIHDNFGRGKVVRVEIIPSGEMLVVNFDGAGEKRLIAKFAPIRKL